MQQGGESGSWIEFIVPDDIPEEDATVDLTQLQGDNALVLLSIVLPDGKYTKVFVHIDKDTGVSGVLTSGGPVTLKLPSSKLQIVKPFEIVGGDPAVDFVFDIAVVAAGSEKSPEGIKYLLLPVISESGPQQSFHILVADAPTADAGADQTVATGALVQLDGSGSSDPEDDSLTYTWTLATPDGSTATLSDTTIVNPSFVADLDGKYVATLVVNDGTSESDPNSVEIEAEAEPDEAPEADAGEDQTVATGATVQLDGSGSNDPGDDSLTYTWTLAAPDGSTATLSDTTIVNPTFVADLDGEYLATLVVNDGTSESDPDSVEIEAEAELNEAPEADAGQDQTVATGATVQLDGSGSSDPEDDSISLQLDPGRSWRQHRYPLGHFHRQPDLCCGSGRGVPGHRGGQRRDQ